MVRLDKYKLARLALRCKTILQTFGDVECSRRVMRLWLTEPWTQIAKVNYVFNSIGELQFGVSQRLSMVWVKIEFLRSLLTVRL